MKIYFAAAIRGGREYAATYHALIAYIETLAEEKGEDGSYHRTLRVYPRLNMPGPIRKLLGERINYIEEGHFDPRTERWVSEVKIAKLASKFKLRTTMWFEDTGPESSIRTAAVDLEIKILGLRRLFEKFVKRVLDDSYEKARIHTNRWAAEHPEI